MRIILVLDLLFSCWLMPMSRWRVWPQRFVCSRAFCKNVADDINDRNVASPNSFVMQAIEVQKHQMSSRLGIDSSKRGASNSLACCRISTEWTLSIFKNVMLRGIVHFSHWCYRIIERSWNIHWNAVIDDVLERSWNIHWNAVIDDVLGSPTNSYRKTLIIEMFLRHQNKWDLRLPGWEWKCHSAIQLMAGVF